MEDESEGEDEWDVVEETDDEGQNLMSRGVLPFERRNGRAVYVRPYAYGSKDNDVTMTMDATGTAFRYLLMPSAGTGFDERRGKSIRMRSIHGVISVFSQTNRAAVYSIALVYDRMPQGGVAITWNDVFTFKTFAEYMPTSNVRWDRTSRFVILRRWIETIGGSPNGPLQATPSTTIEHSADCFRVHHLHLDLKGLPAEFSGGIGTVGSMRAGSLTFVGTSNVNGGFPNIGGYQQFVVCSGTVRLHYTCEDDGVF